MAELALIATVLGSAVTAAGTIAAGKDAKAQANWQALEYERQGKSERASAQRQAEQEQHRKRLAESRLQTVAAASGFTATDPTALGILTGIEEEGTIRAQLAQYGGEDRAAGLQSQATLSRMAGSAAKRKANYTAIGTILGGLGSGLAKYNTGGSTAAPSSYYG